MASKGGREVAVGALFSLALVILAMAIMAVGEGSRLFAEKVGYSVVFPSAEGLVVGSPVKMSGVVVGSVQEIRLSTDPNTTGIEVRIGVDNAYAPRVRDDSRAALRILQLLSGEKFVEIMPGSPDEPPLAEGSKIETLQEQALLEQAAVTAENLNEITISLKNILEQLESGEGLIGQMINDPEFGKEGLEAFRGALVNLEALTGDLRRGRGVVGRLLQDEGFARRLDETFSAVGQLAQSIQALDLEEGAMGALLRDGGPGERAVEDFSAAASSLRRLAERLESEQGILGQMLASPEGQDQFAEDLRRLVSNLAEISDKINRGDGTLGALVNDRTVYEGMEDVVAGVNDSKFARWLIRRYQKRGIKAGDEEGELEQEEVAQDPAIEP
jgi:phospholipid/cholesterol/gamma-HCH transport system substrate-binding protein